MRRFCVLPSGLPGVGERSPDTGVLCPGRFQRCQVTRVPALDFLGRVKPERSVLKGRIILRVQRTEQLCTKMAFVNVKVCHMNSGAGMWPDLIPVKGSKEQSSSGEEEYEEDHEQQS